MSHSINIAAHPAQDLDESPMSLKDFIARHERRRGARHELAHAQRPALEALRWKHAPTFLAWWELLEWLERALAAADHDAVLRQPSSAVQRLELRGGCVVHRVAAWNRTQADDSNKRKPPAPVALDSFLQLRPKPRADRVHALAQWRHEKAWNKRCEPFLRAIVWNIDSPPTAGSWGFVQLAVMRSGDAAYYAEVCRQARSEGHAPPTYEEVEERERQHRLRHRAEVKRRWARFLARRKARDGL